MSDGQNTQVEISTGRYYGDGGCGLLLLTFGVGFVTILGTVLCLLDGTTGWRGALIILAIGSLLVATCVRVFKLMEVGESKRAKEDAAIRKAWRQRLVEASESGDGLPLSKFPPEGSNLHLRLDERHGHLFVVTREVANKSAHIWECRAGEGVLKDLLDGDYSFLFPVKQLSGDVRVHLIRERENLIELEIADATHRLQLCASLGEGPERRDVPVWFREEYELAAHRYL
ncbi:MAG: hypothetical protein V1826_00450 [bacterium]